MTSIPMHESTADIDIHGAWQTESKRAESYRLDIDVSFRANTFRPVNVIRARLYTIDEKFQSSRSSLFSFILSLSLVSIVILAFRFRMITCGLRGICLYHSFIKI